VVYLSRALAKLGRNVRVFGVLPPLRVPGVGPDGVDYQPMKNFNIQDEHGTVVIWRATGLAMQLLQTWTNLVEQKKKDDTVVVPSGIHQLSLWLHDQHTGVNDVTHNQMILENLESVIVLSEHHKRKINQGLTAPKKVRFHTLSNGIVREDMDKYRGKIPKIPGKAVYSSCPSRGLRPLLDMWPEVKAAVPNARLDIFYDWSMLKNNQPELYRDIAQRYEAVKHLDVVHHGGVGHDVLYKHIAEASVWAYSHFENPDVETFCISAIKATALGTQVLTVPNGALPEVSPDADFCKSVDEYKQKLIGHLGSEPTERDKWKLERLALDALDRFDWDKVAERFGRVWSRQYIPEIK